MAIWVATGAATTTSWPEVLAAINWTQDRSVGSTSRGCGPAQGARERGDHMARETVEGCIDKVPNTFELVVLAAHRSIAREGEFAV